MADRLVARYEYDPYGRIVGPDTNSDGKFDGQDDPGFYAAANPFRWTEKGARNLFPAGCGRENVFPKSCDTSCLGRDSPEKGTWHLFRGLRYYSATLGRWLNRDPIGDFGGANVYTYVGNNPSSHVDYLGLKACPKWPGQQPPSSQPQSPASPRAREPFEWDPAKDPKEPNPKPPNCLLECPEACASPEAQAEIASNPDSEAAVICTPHCKCACLDQSNPALSNPRTNYERAERDCKLAHEEYHISDGVTCMWCLKPPCVARHTPFTSECRAYKAQYDCLGQKKSATDCGDPVCQRMLHIARDTAKIAAELEGCDVSRW